MNKSRRRDEASNVSESARTVYSDVSFMGRDTVAFSLRLRQSGSEMRPMGSSMLASFLPDLAPRELLESKSQSKEVASAVSEAAAAELLEDYNGCPEEHPDCIAREERWEQIEEMLRKDTAELQALEGVLFEARAGRDAAKSKREIVISRLEEKDDQNLDKQTNVRKLKDDIQVAKSSTEEQHKAIIKLQLEISSLTLLIAEQEKELANDGSRDSTRTEIVAPHCDLRSPESELEAVAVRSLPRDLVVGKQRGRAAH